MVVPNSPRLRRHAEKLRTFGWINFSVTMLVWFFAPDRVDAIVAACVWVALVLTVSQSAAWLMERKAARIEQPKVMG